MPKERAINPATAQRKAEKQREIHRSKRNVQAQRNEKLARRNPERLQRQIDELKDLDNRGALRAKDKETLVQLERDVKGIRRARDALGDAAPKFANYERRDARQEQRERRQHLGKRRRDSENAFDSESSDTDPGVRSIPMPRDTPPPIPRQHFYDPQIGADGKRVPHALPAKPPAAAAPQTVYTSAPQIRDLKKEAVKFTPTIVSQQRSRARGQGRLLEPEEIDRLEKAGYTAAEKATEEAALEARHSQRGAEMRAEGKPDGDAQEEEIMKFEREIDSIYSAEAEPVLEDGGSSGVVGRPVEIEEVEDDGD